MDKIEEIKKYIKENYSPKVQRQEQYDDSPDYAYEDGETDGSNSTLYAIGEILGMDLEERIYE